jgi:hypothetical protein
MSSDRHLEMIIKPKDTNVGEVRREAKRQMGNYFESHPFTDIAPTYIMMMMMMIVIII